MGINSEADEIELIDINLDDEIEDVDDYTAQQDVKNSITPDEKSNKDNGRKVVTIAKEVFSYVLVFAVAIIVAIVINNFVIINANVPTSSMANTINEEDKLFGYRLAYLFSSPKRGDIVIFEHQCYHTSEKEALIKRVIGLPGDTVEIIDGVLYVNGEVIIEEYLSEAMEGSYGPFEVPENSYFMLGDNRNISDDARFWDNTYVSADDIIAKAVFKYAPSFETIH